MDRLCRCQTCFRVNWCQPVIHTLVLGKCELTTFFFFNNQVNTLGNTNENAKKKNLSVHWQFSESQSLSSDFIEWVFVHLRQMCLP